MFLSISKKIKLEKHTATKLPSTKWNPYTATLIPQTCSIETKDILYDLYVISFFFFFQWLEISSISTYCNNFFSILSEIQPWRSNGYEPCEDTFVRFDSSFRLLSNQMIEMNQTLYLFTTYLLPKKYCQISYLNIQLIHFDATDLLEEFQLQYLIQIFENVYYDEYSKISDILRILIAEKYQFTYIDLDIHFLDYNPQLYSVEFVTMHIWSDNQCTLEITNAAFCLSPYLLKIIRERMVNQILSLDIYKYHTELGPTLFAKALTNINYPIYYYTVNHPESFDISQVVTEIKIYQHHLLHLTSSLRMLLQESQTISFEQFIDQIRQNLNLKPLQLPSSVITQDAMFEAMKAMHLLHPTHHNHHQLGLDITEILIQKHINDCNEGLKSEKDLLETYYECIVILGEIIGSTTVSKSIHHKAVQMMSMLDSGTCTSLEID